MNDPCAGFSGTEKANEDIQRICDKLRPKVEEQTKKEYCEFTATECRGKVIAKFGLGVVFLIKVHVGGVKYIHLDVYRSMVDGEVGLHNVQENKTKDDPLVPSGCGADHSS